MATQQIEGKLPVKNGGVCIYCFGNDPNRRLGDEHILQYSLGGPALLLEASCSRCEAITCSLDGYMANQVFRDLRTHLNVQSRSGHPQTLRTAIDRDGKWHDIELRVKDHPFILAMPIWKKPGILRGAQISNDFGRIFVHAYKYVPPTAASAIGLRPGESVELRYSRSPPDYVKFSRSLAKFAYCDGIRKYGLGGFRSLVTRQIILGEYQNIPHFIGAQSIGPPPPPREVGQQHAITQTQYSFGRTTFLVAEIRFFADTRFENTGMPIYLVVYGAKGSTVIVPKPHLQHPRKAILL